MIKLNAFCNNISTFRFVKKVLSQIGCLLLLTLLLLLHYLNLKIIKTKFYYLAIHCMFYKESIYL